MTTHRNTHKSIWLIGTLLMVSNLSMAQHSVSLTLDSCLAKAKRNYPSIKQYTLIEKAKGYSLANARKACLPQFIVVGQATYQSKATEIPISLPNVNIPSLSKDQYRLYGELSQSLTDLFTVKEQREYICATSEIETQQAEVELYKLQERINHLYFGILLLDAQIQLAELLKKDIQSGIEKTEVAIANGIALEIAVDNLRAEWLKADQGAIELKATRQGYAEVLALFINSPVNESTEFETPLRHILTDSICRPELKLFDLQHKSFDLQRKLSVHKRLPRVNLFLQGGWGRPGLNLLDNDFEAYCIGGLRLSWNIASFYTFRNERKILVNQQNKVNMQRETFLFNTRILLKQQNADLLKMQELIKTDKSIVALRENVKNAVQSQLVYGTATANDYLLAVNAADQARQSLIVHEIQLLMTAYNARTVAGY